MSNRLVHSESDVADLFEAAGINVKVETLGKGGYAKVYLITYTPTHSTTADTTRKIICKVALFNAKLQLETEAGISITLTELTPYVPHIPTCLTYRELGKFQALLLFKYVPLVPRWGTVQQLFQEVVDDRWVREIRILLFQVIFTLAQLQHYYPGFRHNDLTPNNVVLAIPRAFTYHSGTASWKVGWGDSRFSAHIIDFALAHAPSHLHNSDIHDGAYEHAGLLPEANNVYDLHLFLYQFQKMSNLSGSVRAFINRCVPPHLYYIKNLVDPLRGLPRLTHEAQTIETADLQSPRDLLLDRFFDPLRISSSSSSSDGDGKEEEEETVDVVLPPPRLSQL